MVRDFGLWVDYRSPGHEWPCYILASRMKSGPAINRGLFLSSPDNKYVKKQKDGPGIFDDDMGDLRERLIAADAVLLATPMYYAVIDRFYAFNSHITAPKKCYLIVSLCGDDVKTAAGIEREYEITANFLQWKDAGRLIAPSFVRKTPCATPYGLLGPMKWGKICRKPGVARV